MTEQTVTRESVLHDALLLDQQERELLIIQISHSFEKEPGYDEAWSAEIERRLKEVDEGKADLMDWEEARAYIFGGEDEIGAKSGSSPSLTPHGSPAIGPAAEDVLSRSYVPSCQLVR